NDVKINDDDKKEIVTIANMLKKYPEMQIRLIGHTDALGSEEYNQKLSEKRAGVVKNVLLALKVDEKQIITEGRSLNEPIAINANTDGSDNPVGRAFNRRVEFELVNCPDARLKIDPIKVPAELKAQK
ncbi:MAG TPA: OmpA family protein, partial [Bacteroidales bacterium]